MSPIAKMWRDDRAEDELMIITLHDRPLDHPEGVVLRPHYTSTGRVRMHSQGLYMNDLDEAYEFMRAEFSDLYPLARQEGDEPQVVGTWI
jgi:hypothetical protein